jgi:hypothetical protein
MVDRYGDHTTGGAKDAFLALLDKYELSEQNLTIEIFKNRFKTVYQASTNKDDLWQQWHKVYQTTNHDGRTVRIADIATQLE